MVVELEDFRAVVACRRPFAAERFPCGSATAVDIVETRVDKRFTRRQGRCAGISVKVLDLGGHAVLDSRKRASRSTGVGHAQTAIVMLVGGYGGAVVEFKPTRFENRLANGDVAANAIHPPHGEELNGNLAVERRIMLTDEIVQPVNGRC